LNGLNQSFFEFGVTWFRGNINMAAEELESAEFKFEWSFDNTSQLINLYETFPCLYSNISSSAISTSRQNVVVAEQKLNEYSTSCNNVSTSRNNVQH